MKFRAVANTMQGLVKYHGMRDWRLRIPYHDSISVNTSSLGTEVLVTDAPGEGELLVAGRKNEDALRRLEAVSKRLTGKPFSSLSLKIESANFPAVDGKGLGFSSSAGAALAFALQHATSGAAPDYPSLSRAARLFAASASRTVVGGFSRLHAGNDDRGSYAERIADEGDLPLRMVIVPLPSTVRTEEAHEEVESSPFFRSRIESASKRCDELERAIRGGDFQKFGELVEQDTLELHSITMTGKSRMIIMSADTINIITKVREMRSNSVQAYFSMQTGPSVFINTTEEHQEKVKRAMTRAGYRTVASTVGREARLKRT